MTTMPLIQDCVLIALDTVGFEVTGNAAIVNCLSDAITTILVNNGAAYVLGDEGNTYTGTVIPFASDRSAWNALAYATLHTNDADVSTTSIHHTLGTGSDQAAAGNHTHSIVPGDMPLTNTHILVGNVSNVAADVAMSNDATLANTGALTIANDAVTYAKMQNISATQRALGRNTAGAGDTEEITATQLIDWIGATRGAVLYRGASGWAILAPGAAGEVLASNGAGDDPSYQNVISGAVDIYNETITADGVNLTYYLANFAAPSTIRVYIDGIRQPASDDVAPTDTVVFDVAPDAGALILFDYEMDVT